MRSFAIILFAALFSPAHAADTPPIVRAAVEDAAKECRDAGGKPKNFETGISAADLNGDGRLDWIFDLGKVECEEAVSYFCGTGGCQLQIFVSQAAGHARVWEDVTRGWRAVKVRGKPGLQFDLHGSACGLAGYQRCVKRFVFDGAQLILTK